MRVTNQMMAAGMLGNLNQLRSREATLNDQISSGNRITKASDDPLASLDVMRLQSKGNALKQWQSNLSEAKSWVNSTESKLGDITNLLNSARELALQGSNGTQSKDSMQGMAADADQMLQDLLAALNERDPSGAMFGGFVTDKDPFTLTDVTAPDPNDPTKTIVVDKTVTYQGDQGKMQRDVGPGITLTSNISGDRLVGNLAGGWADPDNMLSTVFQLYRGLKDGDGNTVAATVSKLDSARQNVVALRAEMGARQTRVEQLEARHQDLQVQLEDGMQQAQGVDVTKAIIDLNNADTTYRAALQVGGRVLPQTLADFLR